MLYALRYEKHTNNDIVGLVDALKQRGVPEHLTKVSANNTYFLYQ
jgi:vacuolar protein sorting-associated protein 45